MARPWQHTAEFTARTTRHTGRHRGQGASAIGVQKARRMHTEWGVQVQEYAGSAGAHTDACSKHTRNTAAHRRKQGC